MNTLTIFVRVLFSIIFILGVLMWATCNGGGEDYGSCSISFLEPLYNAVKGYVLLLAFTGFIWIPVLVIGMVGMVAKNLRVRASKSKIEGR